MEAIVLIVFATLFLGIAVYVRVRLDRAIRAGVALDDKKQWVNPAYKFAYNAEVAFFVLGAVLAVIGGYLFYTSA